MPTRTKVVPVPSPATPSETVVVQITETPTAKPEKQRVRAAKKSPVSRKVSPRKSRSVSQKEEVVETVEYEDAVAVSPAARAPYSYSFIIFAILILFLIVALVAFFAWRFSWSDEDDVEDVEEE